MWFYNFDLATNKFVVPDETTICRFRNKLIKNNFSEINYLGVILSKVKTENKIKVLFTDKEYASKHNIKILAAKNIGNGIMDKATRNNPLSKKQINRNN